ncbi:MAG: hydroxymethylbilane synthase [Fimbriimonas sp.]
MRPRSRTVRLRLGTRGSRLAMAQANGLAARLTAAGHAVEIVAIKTSGDRGDRDRLGAFVREIQEAVLRNEVDIALHCLKDLPTTPVPGLALSAYLEREDPRDTLISRGPRLEDLPEGAVVGTGSVRRTSQLAAVRPDLVFRPLMGNVDTRMRKLMAGEYDAIVLAIAGLKRLGVLEAWAASEYGSLVVHPLTPQEMLPAPGQAVLVLETRAEDAETIAAVGPLHHPASQRCADAEREFLAAFGGGCSVPVAALGEEDDVYLRLVGLVASADGTRRLCSGLTREVVDVEGMGAALAQALIGEGARELFSVRVATDE